MLSVRVLGPVMVGIFIGTTTGSCANEVVSCAEGGDGGQMRPCYLASFAQQASQSSLQFEFGIGQI